MLAGKLHPQSRELALCVVAAVSVSGAVRHKCPLSDRTCIDVDELTSGVIAYSARSKRERGVSQLHRWNARNPDINRSAFNMFRVLRSVGGSTLAEFIVGLLGSVAAKNLDDTAGSIELSKHCMEEIKGAGVVAYDLVVVAVAQKLAEVVESFGNIRIAYAVNDVKNFTTLAHQPELVLLAFLRYFVSGDNTHAGQAHICQQVAHRMNMRMPVVRGVARMGRWTGSHEQSAGSKCA